MKKIIILFSVVLILTMAFIACNGDNVGEGVTSDDLYTEEISESESEEEISNVETDEPGTDDTTALDTAAQTTEPITTDAVTTDAVTTEAVTTEAATTEAVTTAPSGGGSSSSGGVPSGGGSVGGGTNIPTDPCANGHDFDENGECKNCDEWYSVGLSFKSNGDGTCYLRGLGSFEGVDIIVPEKAPNGDVVVGVDSSAFFRYYKAMKSIELPSSVTTIGSYAFYDCSGLASVTFGENSKLTSIGSYAFYGCSVLSNIDVPSTVTEFGRNAFGDCVNLKSMVIPSGVTKITAGLFSGCSELTSIELSSGITSIDTEAFRGCGALKSIEIPKGVTTIGSSAFYDCSELTNIEIPQSVISIGSYSFGSCSGLTSIIFAENSQLTSIGDHAFSRCNKLSSIEIPEGVTSIGSNVFYQCDALEKIYFSDIARWCAIDFNTNSFLANRKLYFNGELATDIVIPKEVESINKSAFCGYTELKSVSFEESSNLTSIGENAFNGCGELLNIEIPEGITSIGEYAFSGCSKLASVDFGENSQLTRLGGFVFSGCSMLENVKLPSNVTSIEHCMFKDCSGLASIVFPQGLITIGDYAFDGCSSLTSIDIPNGVTSIGDHAFKDCINLKVIDMPSGVTSIGEYAFSGCSKLAGIELPIGITIIDNYLFFGCSDLKSIVIPQNVTRIGIEAFCDSGLERVELSSNLTFINNKAFADCDELLSIKIPSSVTGIGYGVFRDCDKLSSVSFEENSKLAFLESETFYNCIALADIDIPESVTSIDVAAFYGCSALAGIEIPASLTEINEYAFRYCSGLENVTFGENSELTTVKHSAFEGCAALKRIEIPAGVTLIDDNVFKDCNGLETVKLPKTLSWISSWSFSGCSGLESIVIPESVIHIEFWAFKDCIRLETINYTGSEEQWNSITKSASWASNAGSETKKGTYNIVYNFNTYIACTDSHDFDKNGKCLDCGVEKWTLPSGINTYYAYNTSAKAPTIDGEIKTGEYGTATRVSSPRATMGDDINTKWATAEYDATLASEYIDYYFAFDEENVYIALYELGPEFIDNGDSYTQNDVAFRNNHFFQLGFDPSDATSYLCFGGYTTNNIWKNLKYSKNGSLYTAPFGTPELICESVVKTVDVASGKTVGIGDLVSTSGIVNNPSGQWAVTVEFKLSKADIISVINELYGTNYTSLSDSMWIGMTANAFRAKADNLNDVDNQRFRWLGINDITGKQGDYTPYGFSSSSTADHMLDVVVFADKNTQLYKANSDPCSDGHLLVNYAAKAPTESTIGWDAYVSCDRCSYTTYKELPMLGTAFKTGYARCTFTPTPPIGQFSTVHDDLYATCVAVNDGEKTLLLLSIDMKSMSINDNDNIKSIISNSTGIPTGNIFISATHTHSTITFGKDAIWAYNSFKKIEQVAKNAIADLAESEMLSGTGKTTGMAWVRNYINSDGVRATVSPGALFSDTTTRSVGEADDTLQAVRFVRDGKKDIVLLNWQGHLAHGEGQIAGQISADMAQYLREDIESGDRDTLVAFFAGASGNLNLNAPNKTLVKYSDGITSNNHYEVVAHALAKVALAVIEPDEMTSLETGEIKIIKEVYAGLLHKDSPEVVAEAQARKDAGTNTKADDYILARNKKTSLDLRIAAISFGDLGLVTVPYEMFDNNGVQVKEGSPFKMTLVLTNSDGDYAYMPSTEAWTTYGGYETEATYFANGTAEAYVAEYIRLLNSLKNS